MSHNGIEVEIEMVANAGGRKAYAKVRLSLPNGKLILHGFSINQQAGKPPFVGFPQNKGKSEGRYFPVTEAEGELRGEIAVAVLDAYKEAV